MVVKVVVVVVVLTFPRVRRFFGERFGESFPTCSERAGTTVDERFLVNLRVSSFP